jgi:hypothetical protein
LGASPEATGARICADPKSGPPETPIRGEFGGGSFVGESACQDLACLYFFSVVVWEEKTQGEIWEKVIDWQSVLWNFFFGGELCWKPNEFVFEEPISEQSAMNFCREQCS